MDNQKHTPEPWKTGAGYEQQEPGVYIYGGDGLIVSSEDTEITEANARRIVACVNACAGISTEQLEMDISVGGEKSIYESQEAKVQELIQQKNILLEAVKGIVNFHNEHCEDEELYPEFLDLLNAARAAIAKAEAAK